MRILFTLTLSLVCLSSFVGCKSNAKKLAEIKAVARIYVENRGVDYGSPSGTVLKLPQSGARIAVQKTPIATEFDIKNVELVKVDLGLALMVQVNDTASRELYRTSVTNMGARLVTTVNGVAIGARQIDGAMQDGNIFTFVEVPDEELEQLVIDLKEGIIALRSIPSW